MDAAHAKEIYTDNLIDEVNQEVEPLLDRYLADEVTFEEFFAEAFLDVGHSADLYRAYMNHANTLMLTAQKSLKRGDSWGAHKRGQELSKVLQDLGELLLFQNLNYIEKVERDL